MPVHIIYPVDHRDTAMPSDRPQGTSDNCLRIGLVNSMPDGALEATEQQFGSLLRSASSSYQVQLSISTLPGISRSPRAQDYIERSYFRIDDFMGQQLDALIVTGTEPLRPELADEPYWEVLSNLLDWAQHNTVSSIFSCLAAHAGVLKMNGIRRARSTEKSFGVFECLLVDDHPLTLGLPLRYMTPHSRWNSVPEEDLIASGYTVLTRTKDAGPDMFLKQHGKSLLIFLQGHPEYEADTLMREYRRDVARYVRGEKDQHIALPRNYFDAKVSAGLSSLRNKALLLRSQDVLAGVAAVAGKASITNTWQSTSTHIYRNWLAYLSAAKNQQTGTSSETARMKAREVVASRMQSEQISVA